MYGQVVYASGAWYIKTEPHVALRLKRVFGRIRHDSVGVLMLDDTIDNARDLQWFLERYPMECPSLDILNQKASAHRERESVVAQLLAGAMPSLFFPLAVPAREYQEVAASMTKARGSLLLADDVGLGKSISAIAVFNDPQYRPALVVTLAHLPKQWTGFVNRFAPLLRCHTLKKSTPYDLRDKQGNLPDVIFSSYHKLWGWAETLCSVLKMVVWDECQELRHTGTGKYQAARMLADGVSCKMGLSATPFYNYGAEMFNVNECISPGALGHRTEFLTEWCHGGEIIADPPAFGSYMRESGLMLRRTREEVKRELPGCQAIPHQIDSNRVEFSAMEHGCEDLANVILSESEQFRGQKMQAAAEFDMRLRKATGVAKAPYVAAFASMMIEEGESVVLYGWHRDVHEIWMQSLAPYNPALYTGSESPRQKDESKAKFISGESKVLLISLRAGAGLDGLQYVTKTVIFGELDWSPGVHEQCIGRVYRDGQQSPVFAYYLLSNSGSDPVIADTLGLKTQQIEGVRDPNKPLVEALEIDPDHIKKLAREYLKHRGKRQLTLDV